MNHSIVGATSAFDVFKLKDPLLANDAGEWGKGPGTDAVGVLGNPYFLMEETFFLASMTYRPFTYSQKKTTDN